jgi:dienelactone hydrolase
VDAPGVTWLATALTDAPRISDLHFGGVTATLARPARGKRWPAIVLLNGAAARGRRDARIRALAEGLARAGYLVVLPDLPGLRRGELTTETLKAAVAVAEASARRGDARGGKVALFGMSTGGALALLVAERARPARFVRLVAAMGAFTDIRAVLRLATTRTYRAGGRLVGYAPAGFLSLVAGRSLAAALPAGPDRIRLLKALAAVDPTAPDPLAPVRVVPGSSLTSGGRAVVTLLSNRDPQRFDTLYAALPAVVRATCRRLSPVSRAAALRVPVLLAADDRDAYFPPTHARELAAAAPRGAVSIVQTVSHSAPRGFPRGLVDLIRLHRFVVRALRLASA